MIKYIIFRLVLRCLLFAKKDSLTGFSTGLTGYLEPDRQPDRCRSTRPASISDKDHNKLSIYNFLLLTFGVQQLRCLIFAARGLGTASKKILQARDPVSK